MFLKISSWNLMIPWIVISINVKSRFSFCPMDWRYSEWNFHQNWHHLFDKRLLALSQPFFPGPPAVLAATEMMSQQENIPFTHQKFKNKYTKKVQTWGGKQIFLPQKLTILFHDSCGLSVPMKEFLPLTKKKMTVHNLTCKNWYLDRNLTTNLTLLPKIRYEPEDFHSLLLQLPDWTKCKTGDFHSIIITLANVIHGISDDILT